MSHTPLQIAEFYEGSVERQPGKQPFVAINAEDFAEMLAGLRATQSVNAANLDLLAACRAMESYLSQTTVTSFGTVAGMSYPDILAQARAAIAKAEGGAA